MCPFLSRITISDPILLYSLFHYGIGIGDNQSIRMKPERAKSIRPELLHCYIVIKRIHAQLLIVNAKQGGSVSFVHVQCSHEQHFYSHSKYVQGDF